MVMGCRLHGLPNHIILAGCDIIPLLISVWYPMILGVIWLKGCRIVKKLSRKKL